MGMHKDQSVSSWRHRHIVSIGDLFGGRVYRDTGGTWHCAEDYDPKAPPVGTHLVTCSVQSPKDEVSPTVKPDAALPVSECLAAYLAEIHSAYGTAELLMLNVDNDGRGSFTVTTEIAELLNAAP